MSFFKARRIAEFSGIWFMTVNVKWGKSLPDWPHKRLEVAVHKLIRTCIASVSVAYTNSTSMQTRRKLSIHWKICWLDNFLHLQFFLLKNDDWGILQATSWFIVRFKPIYIVQTFYQIDRRFSEALFDKDFLDLSTRENSRGNHKWFLTYAMKLKVFDMCLI